jgi:hypothetical protein
MSSSTEGDLKRKMMVDGVDEGGGWFAHYLCAKEEAKESSNDG